jgi:hypothetical protein
MKAFVFEEVKTQNSVYKKDCAAKKLKQEQPTSLVFNEREYGA